MHSAVIAAGTLSVVSDQSISTRSRSIRQATYSSAGDSSPNPASRPQAYPTTQNTSAYSPTVWLAGGGVKRGFAHGATDEFGHLAVENRVHMHDLHATILHLLGLDHERLTYTYAGRPFRLTDVAGSVVKEIIA